MSRACSVFRAARGRDQRRPAVHDVCRRRPDRRAAGARARRCAARSRCSCPPTCRADSAFSAPPPLATGRGWRRGPPSRPRPRRTLMAGPLAPKLALARAVGAVSRLRGGGATSAPGKVLMRLDPDAIGELGARLPRGSVLVSATNGKTTTARDARRDPRARRRLARAQPGRARTWPAGSPRRCSPPRARAGASPASSACSRSTSCGSTRSPPQLHPRAILLGNLFRDQLDRYGELETIAERWDAARAHRTGPRSTLVLNADDPLIADLGRERAAPVCTSASRTTRSRWRAWRTPPTPSTAAAAARRTCSTRSTSAISATTTARAAARRVPRRTVTATRRAPSGRARGPLHAADARRRGRGRAGAARPLQRLQRARRRRARHRARGRPARDRRRACRRRGPRSGAPRP